MLLQNFISCITTAPFAQLLLLLLQSSWPQNCWLDNDTTAQADGACPTCMLQGALDFVKVEGVGLVLVKELKAAGQHTMTHKRVSAQSVCGVVVQAGFGQDA